MKFLSAILVMILALLGQAQAQSVSGGFPGWVPSALPGSTNSLLYNNGGALGAITPVNNAVLITSGSGVPSESTTLPTGLTIIGAAQLGVSGTTSANNSNFTITDTGTTTYDTLDVRFNSDNITGTRSAAAAVKGFMYITPASAGGNCGTCVANYGYAEADANSAGTRIEATGSDLNVTGGTWTYANGLSDVTTITGGTVTNANAILSEGAQVSGGSVTNLVGLRLDSNTNTGGTVTNNYGLYVDAQAGVGGTINDEAFFNSTAPTYFDAAGNAVIGASLQAGVITSTVASGANHMVINAPSGQQAGLYLNVASGNKYQLNANSDSTFTFWDGVSGASIMGINSGNLTIGESGKTLNLIGTIQTGGTATKTETCTITATETLIFTQGLLTGGTCTS